MTSHAVNGGRALLFNKFYFLCDQVNFDNNINFYTRLCSDSNQASKYLDYRSTPQLPTDLLIL